MFAADSNVDIKDERANFLIMGFWDGKKTLWEMVTEHIRTIPS